MHAINRCLLLLCLITSTTLSAGELNTDSFKMSIPAQWTLLGSRDDMHIYGNKNSEKIRITYAQAFESYNKSEEVLKSVMLHSAKQGELGIISPLRKHEFGTGNVWVIESVTTNKSLFLNQYGVVGEEQVVFIAHTGKTTHIETKKQLLTSLVNIVWTN